MTPDPFDKNTRIQCHDKQYSEVKQRATIRGKRTNETKKSPVVVGTECINRYNIGYNIGTSSCATTGQQDIVPEEKSQPREK